jgi:hypothetical protein
MAAGARRLVALRPLVAVAALACAACSSTSLTPKTVPGTGIHPVDSVAVATTLIARMQVAAPAISRVQKVHRVWRRR